MTTFCVKRQRGSDLYRVMLVREDGRALYVAAIVAPLSELLERRIFREPKDALPIFGDRWCAIFNNEGRDYALFGNRDEAITAVLAELQ